MLLQSIKESIKLAVRTKEVLFWTMIFPLLLSTMFYFSFGKLDEAEQVSIIPVAVVEDEAYQADPTLEALLNTLSEGENAMLQLNSCESEEAALQLLEAGEVDGCIQIEENEPLLIVKEEGINQTILRQILNQYKQTSYSITEAVQEAQNLGDPQMMQQILESIDALQSEEQTSASMVEQVSLTRSNPSNMLGFFYGLLGMVCLFGSFHGNNAVIRLQANQSALGARRCISPRKYTIEMLGSVIGSVIVHVISVWITLAFQALVLKIDFGGRLPLAMICCTSGAMVGVGMGVLMGSFPKLSANAKTGLSVAVSMVLSFLAGLMVGGMNYWVHQHIPPLSWINPAARLVDALQSLYYFDSLSTFWLNNALLLVFAVAFFLLSALRLRRYQYESI
jgi:ABC-2 type transport system permease protein